MRYLYALAVVGLTLAMARVSDAQTVFNPLISKAEARLHGLERSWFTHVSLDRSRDRLTNVVLDGPHLFAQTDHSLLQVLDAETGGRVWTAQVGNRDYPASPPAANEKFVAVINGSTLYVLDRETGRTVREQRLKWVPAGTVSVSENWAYIPTLNSQVEVFGLNDPKLRWNCGSAGYIDQPPLISRHAMVWGTSKGYVNFASPSVGKVDFRMQTGGSVSAPMGYWPPLVLAASRDGHLYAIDERTGHEAWRYSLGTAVNETPVALEGCVFVVPERGGMHCLAAEDGSVRWFNPKAMRVLAVTPTHVYAVDRFGNTLILDLKTGGHVDTLLTWQYPVKYTNLSNDRLYFGTSTGTLFCMRESSLAEPSLHQLPDDAPAEKSDGAKPMTPMPSAPGAPAPANDPFGAPPAKPAGAPAPANDPFGAPAPPANNNDPFGAKP